MKFNHKIQLFIIIIILSIAAFGAKYFFDSGSIEDKTAVESNEDKAFAFYQSALKDKQAGHFEAAREKLESSLMYFDEKNTAYPQIQDELYFHLPMAKARQYLENQKLKELEALLKSVEPYLKNNPRRFEYMQAIDSYHTAMNHLKYAFKMSAVGKLRNIEQILELFNAENGKYPENQKVFTELISYYLSGNLVIKSYTLNKNSYHAVFFDKKREF